MEIFFDIVYYEFPTPFVDPFVRKARISFIPKVSMEHDTILKINSLQANSKAIPIE